MVHHCHEMICRSCEPARSYRKPHSRLLVQDAANLLNIIPTTNGLGQELGEQLAVVDQQIVALCEPPEYEGS